MNAATAAVAIAVGVLFILSLRYSLKHDSCSSCGNAASCGHTRKECSHGSRGSSLYSRYKKDHPSAVEQP
ncbi:MAG: hypothetical protein EOM64_03180 [Erysipelotrichia bacterium]|nr:hypothetical protein [Erysipelotrichia bacterium]